MFVPAERKTEMEENNNETEGKRLTFELHRALDHPSKECAVIQIIVTIVNCHQRFSDKSVKMWKDKRVIQNTIHWVNAWEKSRISFLRLLIMSAAVWVLTPIICNWKFFIVEGFFVITLLATRRRNRVSMSMMKAKEHRITPPMKSNLGRKVIRSCWDTNGCASIVDIFPVIILFSLILTAIKLQIPSVCLFVSLFVRTVFSETNRPSSLFLGREPYPLTWFFWLSNSILMHGNFFFPHASNP